MRPLRALPGLLPDVRRARHGDGLAAGADLSHQGARRGAHGAHRYDGAAPLPLPRLPRLRDGLPGGRALRPAHRGGEGRDRARAAGLARAPPLPLAQLRAPARTPVGTEARSDGAQALPGERAPGARPPEPPRPAPAGDAPRVGGAPALAAAAPRARAAAILRHGGGRPARARRAADGLRPVGGLRRPQPGDGARPGEERLRRHRPGWPGLLWRAQRPRRRPRARPRDVAADDRGVRVRARRRRDRQHLGLRRPHEGVRRAARRRPRLGRAREALRRVGPGPLGVPRQGAPRSTAPPRRAAGHLPRSLPRGARAEDPQGAAPAPRADPGAQRRGSRRVGLVLRLGGHLQPHPARDGRPAARA